MYLNDTKIKLIYISGFVVWHIQQEKVIRQEKK